MVRSFPSTGLASGRPTLVIDSYEVLFVEKKSDQAAKAADLKKTLETVAGHEIVASQEQLISLWMRVGSSNYSDGAITFRSIILPGKSCSPATFLDVDGASSTGTDGKRVFLLSEFACLPQLHSFAEPINIVATPRSAAPFFVTVTHTLVGTGTSSDVQITVFAWDANGTPAPNVVFDWRCRVISVQIIG
jgi:hypothetical protein